MSYAVVLSALRLVLSGGIYVPPQLIQLPPRSGNRAGAHPLGLTARQFEVLTKMVQGTSNKEIARVFNLSGATIKAHIGAIFKTLKVSSRVEAIRITQGL